MKWRVLVRSEIYFTFAPDISTECFGKITTLTQIENMSNTNEMMQNTNQNTNQNTQEVYYGTRQLVIRTLRQLDLSPDEVPGENTIIVAFHHQVFAIYADDDKPGITIRLNCGWMDQHDHKAFRCMQKAINRVGADTPYRFNYAPFEDVYIFSGWRQVLFHQATDNPTGCMYSLLYDGSALCEMIDEEMRRMGFTNKLPMRAN